jgi:hypothetical protein
MVTGVLIKLNLDPRTAYGNWSHHETIKMYRVHICQNASLKFKERQVLRSLLPKFQVLLEKRYAADYGTLSEADLSLVQSYWRDASRLSTFLNSLLKRGVL